MENRAAERTGSPIIADRLLPEIPFRTFLDAKYELDSRSLNPRVKSRFLSEVRKRTATTGEPLRILDAGTGTGATLRRMQAWLPGLPFDFLGIDLDETSLAHTASEWSREVPGSSGGDGRHANRIAFLPADLLTFSLPPGTGPLHCLTAHSLLDLLPPDRALGAIADLLPPGGLLYTTLNYRGGTEFSPRYHDRKFERELLRWYDMTMDERRLDGLPTGGSRTGRLLRSAAGSRGFTVLADGRSDWRIVPRNGTYLPGEEQVLLALLGYIRKEGGRRTGLAGPGLERWLGDRLDRIGGGRLSLRVAHSDLLARRDSP